MNKKKIDKETAIKSILSDLKKGIDKKSIFGKLRKISEIPKSTIYDWYAEAEKRHQPYLKKIQEVENKTIEKVIAEKVTSNILSKLDRQLILSQIASGTIRPWKEISTKEGIQRAEYTDQIRAIAELNKMDGAYIQTGSEGEDEFKGFEIDEI